VLSVWEMAAHLLLFVSLCVVCRVGVLSPLSVSVGVSACASLRVCCGPAACHMRHGLLDLFYFLRFMTYEHPTATPKSKSTVRVTSVNVRTPVQNGTTSNFTNGIVFTYGSCYGYFTVTSEQTSAL